MRIAFDVSPLSHPRTGIGNYIRGSLAGPGGGGRPGARDRRLRADEPAGPPRDPRGSRRPPGRGAPARASRLTPLPHGVEQAWAPAGRALPRAVRRPPLHGLDVPAAAGGVRATTIHDLVPLRFPEWVTPRTRRDARREVRRTARTCDVIFTNSGYTANDVVELLGVPRERVRVARPGLGPGFSADGRRADLGGPYILGVGTLEPRKNLARLVEAWRLLDGGLSARARGRRGLGRAAAARRPRHSSARLRLRRGAAGALPRRGGLRLPVAVRGLRDPDRRGDGVRDARRRLSAPVARRGLRRRGRSRRPRRSGGDRRRDRRGDRPPRRARAEGARARRAVHLARGRGDDPARLRGGA